MDFDIVNGPGRDDLLDSLKSLGSCRQSVVFRLAALYLGAPELHVVVNKMEREDGSGFSWILTGYLANLGRQVKICYRTDRRKGCATVP